MMTKSIQTAEKYKSTATEIKQRLKKNQYLTLNVGIIKQLKRLNKEKAANH